MHGKPIREVKLSLGIHADMIMHDAHNLQMPSPVLPRAACMVQGVPVVADIGREILVLKNNEDITRAIRDHWNNTGKLPLCVIVQAHGESDATP